MLVGVTAHATISDGILARLRHETRAEHHAIERVLDPTRELLTLDAYRRWLARLYGFHRPMEPRLRPIPGLDMNTRRKTSLLEADLVALGSPDPRSLAVCESLPPLTSAAARFGCAYVLEGATLGGRIVDRHVRRVLGVTPATGGRFLHGYGPRTGEMWQAFGAALTAFADTTATRDEVVAAAIATFRTLRRWCEQGRPA